VETVVARFHHPTRDLDELEELLGDAGAKAPRITGYTVVLTFDSDSHEQAIQAARKALDRVGATRIKVTKRGKKLAAVA
jgi:hypothetical protein